MKTAADALTPLLVYKRLFVASKLSTGQGSAGNNLRSTALGLPHRPEAAIRLSHSITSSARVSIDCGTVRPSALAVLRLMTSSNFDACWTGRSAGLAPLRTFPA